mgnify:CR=1 FL=1
MEEARTSLIEAIESNDLALVKSILEEAHHAYPYVGFDPDRYGLTVLLLISRGFDPRTYECELANMFARRVSPEILQFILHPRHRRFVGNLENVDHLGRTALQNACMYLNIPLVDFLVHAGADVNSKGRGDETPLHYACRAGITASGTIGFSKDHAAL